METQSLLITTYNFNILQHYDNNTQSCKARQTVTIRFNVTNNGLSPSIQRLFMECAELNSLQPGNCNTSITPAGFSYNPLNGTIEYTGGNINPVQTLIFEFNAK